MAVGGVYTPTTTAISKPVPWKLDGWTRDITVQLWDTGGGDGNKAMRMLAYKDAVTHQYTFCSVTLLLLCSGIALSAFQPLFSKHVAPSGAICARGPRRH